MTSIGKRIKQVRKLHGLTQEALAEKCGVSTSCVSRWETDNLVPNRVHQETIATALEIEMGDLYASSEAELPSNMIIREIVKMLSEMTSQE